MEQVSPPTLVEYDVVVVGLGPTGDSVAGLAALEGLSVLAVERDADPYPLPRAAAFDHEVMRIFQRLGVADTLVPLCRVPSKFEFHDAAGEVIFEMPTSGMATPSGWEASYLLHQPAVEAVLRDRAATLGVTMRFGVSFRDFHQDKDGVDVIVEGPDGLETIRARFLIGCDGGRSPVRERAGLRLFDYQFNEPWLVIDVITDAHDALPQVGLQVCDPARPTTFMRMTGNRYRWEFMMRKDENPLRMTDESFVLSLLSTWIDPNLVTIERKALYDFHGLVAEQWRNARVLIAGDAAHQMPPFAAQGMCAGIRDAANLAWKLGSVIRGDADDTLLDSYQAEREMHVRAVIEASIEIGRIVCLQDEAAAAQRNAAMRARSNAGEPPYPVAYPPLRGGLLEDTPHAGEALPQFAVGETRLDDRLARHFCLIGRDLPDRLSSWMTGYDLNGGALPEFAPALSAWLEEAGASAVLVRPDKHIFGVGNGRALLHAAQAAMRHEPGLVS